MRDFNKILPRGKENAVKGSVLAAELGYTSERALRLDIADFRASGGLVCSSAKGGYYLPGNREELREFICTMEHHAEGVYKAIRSARQALKQIEGQMSINECTDIAQSP